MPAEPTPTWLWVRDKQTGHEYDVAPEAFNDAAHEDLSRPSYSTYPRPAKTRVGKDGDPAAAPTTRTRKQEA